MYAHESRKLQHKKDNARKKASLHCKHFYECNAKAAFSDKEMKCHECKEFDKLCGDENTYMNELTSNIFYKDQDVYSINEAMR